MATVSSCSYGQSITQDTLYSYYAQSSYQTMADHLAGAASMWNYDSMYCMSFGVLENSPGSDWLQLGSAAISSFITWWSSHNSTGQALPTQSQVSQYNGINAHAGIYWLNQGGSCGYTNWQGAVSQATYYNSTCNCSCPYTGAYGFSALFLAYGSGYQVGSYNYRGAYYPTSPTGTQPIYLSANSNNSCGSPGSLPVPTYNVGQVLRYNPWGRNAAGKQILLLASSGTPTDYVSALQVELNIISKGTAYEEPVVTTDATFAAKSTQGGSVCVIAVGQVAVNAINSAAVSLGYNCYEYSDFSSWESSTYGYGYVAANGLTGTDSYNLADQAAQSAFTAGF